MLYLLIISICCLTLSSCIASKTFLMNSGSMPQQCALRTAFFEDFVVASCLQNRSYRVLSCNVPISRATRILLAKFLNEVVVAFVNLLAQFAQVFGAFACLVADHEQVEDVIQYIRCDLLGSIAPCTVRIAVALHNQTVES